VWQLLAGLESQGMAHNLSVFEPLRCMQTSSWCVGLIAWKQQKYYDRVEGGEGDRRPVYTDFDIVVNLITFLCLVTLLVGC